MADGLMCWQSGVFWKGYDGSSQGIARIYPGKSTLVTSDNNYSTITDYLKVNLYSYPEYKNMKVVQRIASTLAFSINNNLGYTRLINPYHNLEVLTFNGDRSISKPLRTLKTSYLETMILNPWETGIKIKSSYDEGAGKDGIQHSVTISELISDNVVIENCSFIDNHRGGISGGSNNVTIRNCVFSKNSVTENYAGKTAPLYLIAGTNYHIDFEDSYAKNLKICGCSFSRDKDIIGKILLGVYTVDFHDNVSDTPVSIYNNLLSNVHDNKFSSAPISFSPWRLSDFDEGLQKHGFKYLTRAVMVTNNKIKSSFSNSGDSHTILMQSNNY